LLVTIPPLQISRSVATHVSHANRFSHLLYSRNFGMTAELREVGCRIGDWAPIERRYRKTIRPVSAKRRQQARCAVVVQDAAKHRRLARPHSEAWARLVAELCPVGLR